MKQKLEALEAASPTSPAVAARQEALQGYISTAVRYIDAVREAMKIKVELDAAGGRLVSFGGQVAGAVAVAPLLLDPRLVDGFAREIDRKSALRIEEPGNPLNPGYRPPTYSVRLAQHYGLNNPGECIGVTLAEAWRLIDTCAATWARPDAIPPRPPELPAPAADHRRRVRMLQAVDGHKVGAVVPVTIADAQRLVTAGFATPA